MRKIGFLLIVLTYSCVTHREVLRSTWQPNEVKVDAEFSEWLLPLSYHCINTKISYSLSNDSTHLYIGMSITDEQMQAKIIRAGLTVKLDTLGSKEGPFTILFPRGLSLFDMRPSQPRVKATDQISILKNSFRLEDQKVSLSGFKVGNGVYDINQSPHITVKMDWDSTNVLQYEAAIPLYVFWKERINTSDISKKFSFCVVVNALSRPEVDRPSGAGMPQGMPRGGGGPAGGGAGPRGGMGPGAGTSGGGIPPNRREGTQNRPHDIMFKEQKLHTLFTLALE